MSPALQPLPIDPLLPQLIEALRSGPAVVLEAAPGAGKTTRVPAALHSAELSPGLEIIVAEPRRLAARMAAQRVAAERCEPLGALVGYRVRFEEVVSDATRIVYVTEGILLRRFLKDPTLAGVGVVILDEFHERHLETDLLLALLWRLSQGARPDLKLVVMSATLDAAHVAQYLGGCPRVHSTGRVFPIELEHLPQVDARPLEKQVVSAVRRLLAEQAQGDVLVFLPGAAEIRRASSAMEGLAQEQSLRVLPLHGDLPMAEQVRAIERAPQRKVVLSTNVAESSVTIDGVSAVVDSGLARVAAHSPWSGLPTLTTAKISRASATQRAGRAGRTQAGRVLRLYTRGDFLTRPEHDEPEITRSDLTEALLLLHAIGGGRAPAMSFITEPAAAALNAARAALEALGALAADGCLNATGRRLLELPVHPRLARVIVEGERRGVARKAALLAALLGERDVRLAGRTDFGRARSQPDTVSGPSDVLALADAFELARSLNFDPRRLRAHELDIRAVDTVARVEKQLCRVVRNRAPEPQHPEDEEQALLLSILSGFVDRLARRRKPGGNELILTGGNTAQLDPSSVVREGELMVAVAVEERAWGSLGSGATVRLASSVKSDWLLDFYPEQLRMTDELTWNADRERVELCSRMTFGSVVLDESRSAAPPSGAASEMLCRAVAGTGAQEFLQNDVLTSLLERCALLATHFPAAFVDYQAGESRAMVLALCAGKTSFAELRGADLAQAMLAGLDGEQRRLLEREAPAQLRLPNGRSVPIHYEQGKPPWIESRLQDFFGMTTGPRVCAGRLPITLHLLAPNARAVQVTTDLEGFWERHYPSIRRELMRRYPRHAWPEDGRHATPPPPRKPR